MKKNYLFVANWKMHINYSEAIHFCSENKKSLSALCQHHHLIICPSFVAVSHAAEQLKETKVHLGAQDCSAFAQGSHTGQISAKSLHEVGCSYCIIGHSERRAQLNETHESIAEKTIRLLESNIIPIICIGESELDALNSRTYAVLSEQLEPIFLNLQTHAYKNISLIFAYEPVWAIGTGVIPEKEYLVDVFAWLHNTLARYIPKDRFQLLYGGSVNEKNILTLKQTTYIDGFLIGKASTDFMQLKAIIESDQD